jgi:hypothetical protein
MCRLPDINFGLAKICLRARGLAMALRRVGR